MYADKFYSGLFSQLNLIPGKSGIQPGDGFTMVPKDSTGEGYLWTYPVNAFCSINIYHLCFYNEMHYRYYHPKMLVLSQSSYYVAKAIKNNSCNQKNQLIGYYLANGEHEYTIPAGIWLDSVGVSIFPEYYEKYLPKIFHQDFSSLSEIVPQIGTDLFIPKISIILDDIATYTPTSEISEVYYEAKIMEIIATLLSWKTNAIHNFINTDDSEALHRLGHYLEQNFSYPTDIQMYARMCNMSKSKLSELFHSIYGYTIVEFIKNCRIDKAKRLLLENDLSIKQIASAVGYSHQSSFTYIFKQHVGCTPREYRKANSNFHSFSSTISTSKNYL
ncbi:TPA: helix-turn-helix transcriptional regulator [Streptococcus agalactiae]|nr:helix-turn-helix transcriptional regulator [Streptococcus agalactiae]